VKFTLTKDDVSPTLSRLAAAARNPLPIFRAMGYPRSVNKPAARQKAISYVQPSGFDILAGARPASARDGWAEKW
jgi:hypothetical protein